MKYTVALAFSFSISALAQTSPIPLSQAGLSPQLNRILQTSVVELDSPSGDSFCSSFFVSKDGYLLTALHCLRQCLVAQGKMDEASSLAIGLQDLAVVHDSKNVQATCARLVDPALGNPNVDVIATGPAIANFDPTFFNVYPVFYNDLKDRGWQSRANDFALVKIHSFSPPTSCLKFNTGVLQSTVDAIGFIPSLCPSGKTCNTVSLNLVASLGKIYSSVKDSVAFSTRPTDGEQKWLLDQFADPGIFFSSASNSQGQSGGPVLDTSGNVIGIVSGYMTSIVKNSGQNQEIHELTAVSLTHVLNQLPPAVAQSLVAKNLQCGQ